LEELKRGVFRYPDATERLRDALKSKKIEAYVFSDILEVANEEWRNAVEGWLNTQRFNVLVGEDDFQRALEVYRSLPRSVAGVGIPDLEKMRASRPMEGSLFHVIRPLSPLAEIYASHVLGDVMMATVETLRKHGKSVTKECMRYSSFTASRIREEIYERWYIGRAAKERRIVFLRGEITRLRASIDGLASGMEKAERHIDMLGRGLAALAEIRGFAGADELLSQRLEEANRLEEQKASIDTTSFDSLKQRIEDLKAELAFLDGKRGDLISARGSTEARITSLEERGPALQSDREEKKSAFDEFFGTITDPDEYRRYYDERVRQNRPDELLKNYSAAVKNAATRKENLLGEYIRQTTQYNRDHSESLSGDPSLGDEIALLLKKYRDTELPTYLERIKKARHDAEQQFMGDFVSRLSENLANARESVRELNQTLKSITFGRNRYKFAIEEMKEKKREIGVIKKAAEISRNANTLFESLTTPEDKKVVEDLFRTILEKDLSSPEVRSICDYRTYFQYDIRMMETIDAPSGEGNDVREIESSLSRVIREKSGGEAQTPYYVAIAASFLRFFRGGKSTVRLALFDEAFNKMDDSRIGTTIDFFKTIGIQVITAVPTEKIETIAPFMDVTNLVIRHGLAAAVREYRIRTTEQEIARG
jgi:DNA repair exonuclease SbcCD ATPase subunit